jgi:hypothetical protein
LGRWLVGWVFGCWVGISSCPGVVGVVGSKCWRELTRRDHCRAQEAVQEGARKISRQC